MTTIVDRVLNHCDYSTGTDIGEEIRLRNLITENFTLAPIEEVKKLYNKYLYASFMLKKSEKKDYQIIELIHSTAASNVSSIEKNNLDWRRVVRAKYGYGVAFSKNSDYANFHSSWSGGIRRAFIVCDVLVGQMQLVEDNTKEVPVKECIDTFRSSNGYVYVKFDDFTFYPKYAFYYQKPNYRLSSFYTRR